MVVLQDVPIKVRYKYNNGDRYGDLICELTEFMDRYLITYSELSRTYLYNDISVMFKHGFLQISFRVPRCYKGFISTRKT